MRFCLSTCRSTAPECRRAERNGKPSLPNRGPLMRNRTAEEVLPANLAEHRAVKAWSQLEPERIEPETIEVLRLTRKKSAVYRMTGVGPNDAAVVAKRCRTMTASVERVIYETVLSRLSLPALGCYGFVPEPGGEFCWLFLEEVGMYVYSPDNAE